MAAKKKAMSTVKQILRLRKNKEPIKSISRIVGVSRNTIKQYFRLQGDSGFGIDELLVMDDISLQELFTKAISANHSDRYTYFESQFEYWIKELSRVGVTRYLLWQEYHIPTSNHIFKV